MWLIELIPLTSLLLTLWGTAVRPEQGSLAVTEVRDRRGERIGFLDFRAGVKSRPLTEIPQRLRELVLLAEDRRFFQHAGIDYPRLVRALVSQEGGASTITQQWVRVRAGIPRRWWTKPCCNAQVCIGLSCIIIWVGTLICWNSVMFGGTTKWNR